MANETTTGIAVLGSTGSIGTQTLDIIEEYPQLFKARVLTAGHNWQLLAEQALRHKPELVVIADEAGYLPLKEALSDTDIEVASGSRAISEAVATEGIDLVVTAMVGYSGLIPTVSALKAGKRIALANKETLVVGGAVIYSFTNRKEGRIIPVDSEHSAIFQCLQGERHEDMRRIILTASGGPFRTFEKDRLHHVKAADALRHPNWDMGAKVTIDSASMMNKGFEMMEASWLFDCPPENIRIVVHPQSIVHSMVEFSDGSVKAQLGLHDMRMPIRYALGYPGRLATERAHLPLSSYTTLTFEEPDFERFPMLTLAFEAAAAGGNLPCILNAANEIGVAAFLKDEIRFTHLQEIASTTMEKATWIAHPTLDDLVTSNQEARAIAEEIKEKLRI